MNATCIICSDLFTPRSEIFTTACGHLFHQQCLTKWIERSQTCPQCRHAETSDTIHRIYLNFASAEGIADDIFSLQAKLDTVKFEISLKDKDIAKYSHKYNACKENCSKMRESIVKMEQNQRMHESRMVAMRNQIHSYKERMCDKEKLVAEIEQLKKQIDNMDQLKSLISDCDSQVNQMLNLNNDPESLKILVVTLKRQLEEVQAKNQMMSTKICRIGKEMLSINSTMDKLQSQTKQAKNDLVVHKHCASEINYLKEKIINAKKSIESPAGNCTITSAPIQTLDSIIILDSPPSTPSLARSHNQPSQAPRIIATSDIATLQAEQQLQPCSEESGQSPASASSSQNKPTSSVPSKTNLKRLKPTSSFTTSSKFRKLAPGNVRKPS